ncbi:MAG: hypothetical protein KC619_32825, partial [Myxococcales bacterium]|nr:hypothetical protein [Myxococcales bacterium]
MRAHRWAALGLFLFATACDGDMPPGGCRTGETDCDGTCVNTDSDARNCGGCGMACGAGEVCAAGACDAAGCSGGTTECDRACVDTDTDERHCGGCGMACA